MTYITIADDEEFLSKTSPSGDTMGWGIESGMELKDSLHI